MRLPIRTERVGLRHRAQGQDAPVMISLEDMGSFDLDTEKIDLAREPLGQALVVVEGIALKP